MKTLEKILSVCFNVIGFIVFYVFIFAVMPFKLVINGMLWFGKKFKTKKN